MPFLTVVHEIAIPSETTIVSNPNVDISTSTYTVDGGVYNSIQLIVVSGTVTQGNIKYPPGVYSKSAKDGYLLPELEYVATGEAYLDLMS